METNNNLSKDEVAYTSNGKGKLQGKAGSKARGKPGYKRPQKVLPPCTICLQTATGIHYGVPTCEACKAFFYRNFKRREKLYCDYDNSCRPADGGATWCSACRMATCVSSGMSLDGIKMGRYSFEKKAKYRSDAVSTGKISKKKISSNNTGLKEILADVEGSKETVALHGNTQNEGSHSGLSEDMDFSPSTTESSSSCGKSNMDPVIGNFFSGKSQNVNFSEEDFGNNVNPSPDVDMFKSGSGTALTALSPETGSSFSSPSPFDAFSSDSDTSFGVLSPFSSNCKPSDNFSQTAIYHEVSKLPGINYHPSPPFQTYQQITPNLIQNSCAISPIQSVNSGLSTSPCESLESSESGYTGTTAFHPSPSSIPMVSPMQPQDSDQAMSQCSSVESMDFTLKLLPMSSNATQSCVQSVIPCESLESVQSGFPDSTTVPAAAMHGHLMHGESLSTCCAENWSSKKVQETPSLTEQLFNIIGGNPIKSCDLDNSLNGIEIQLQPRSGSRILDRGQSRTASKSVCSDIMVTSQLLQKVHRGQFSDRHDTVSEISNQNKGITEDSEKTTDGAKTIFEMNFLANQNYCSENEATNQKGSSFENEEDKEFQIILKNSTYSSSQEVSVLKNVMKSMSPSQNPYSHNYNIVLSPKTADNELEMICDQIYRLAIAHDSSQTTFQDLDKLCLESYNQYKESRQLTGDFFGALEPLSHEEHHDLYTSTGIDIDNRYEFIRWFCGSYEHDLKSYTRFCKDLPEFTTMPIVDQMSLIRKASAGFFMMLGIWMIDIENKIVTYPDESNREVRTFHVDDFRVLFSKEYMDLWFSLLKKLQGFKLNEIQLCILSTLYIHSKEFAKTDEGYSTASRLQHILTEALRYSLRRTRSDDPTLLPRVMRFLARDLEAFRLADARETLTVYNKFGAIMNICLPLTYDMYCDDD